MNGTKDISELSTAWQTAPRWQGIERPYSPEDVVQLRGTIKIEYTLAQMGAEKLWELLQNEPFVRALGALTGLQAVQQVQAGLKAIYVSGWQIAADANDASQTYPDQSLYPVDSAPNLIRRINNALIRADQIHHAEGKNDFDWFAPIVADAEAGFGGSLNTFELVKAMIQAGTAGIHLEDQLSSLKKCGHMGGKVLVPVSTFIEKLIAARLACDVMDVPTVLIARTDSNGAKLLRSDIDPVDQPFLTGERSSEGYFRVKGGIEYAINRGLAYAPYCDLIWCETAKPDLGEARDFAQGIHEKYPGKLLAYNCSPSFNWRRHLSHDEVLTFQEKLADMGYKFQFVTLAGFHSLNAGMFELAREYREQGMAAYSRLQQREFELEKQHNFSAIKHQAFVGAGYFDNVQLILSAGNASTAALPGSTEEEQFTPDMKVEKPSGDGRSSPIN
jgi:isocitrate lyase